MLNMIKTDWWNMQKDDTNGDGENDEEENINYESDVIMIERWAEDTQNKGEHMMVKNQYKNMS